MPLTPTPPPAAPRPAPPLAAVRRVLDRYRRAALTPPPRTGEPVRRARRTG